jgi:hypothetical protein
MKIIFSLQPLTNHPPFEQHRVSLVEAIYYREMASGLANTHTHEDGNLL